MMLRNKMQQYNMLCNIACRCNILAMIEHIAAMFSSNFLKGEAPHFAP